MENTDINLKSENLLDTYKDNEKTIARFQLEVVGLKWQLEETDLYKLIKEKEQYIKVLQNSNEEYKKIVKEKMLASWLKMLETFTHRITVKWTVGSLEIYNDKIVPEMYIKEVKPVFDNVKIKSDIKDWKEIPWCKVNESRSLLITEKDA